MKFLLRFAQPWWVNLILLIPFIVYFAWKGKIKLNNSTLILAGLFGISFGFVESSVVVYLRGAIGLLKDCGISLPDKMISYDTYRQLHILNEIPNYLLLVEIYREIATVFMIFSVAMLSSDKWRERLAMFFWIFALWDIFYYIGLKLSIGWPRFLTDGDLLFLLPVPWFAQVWFPVLTSLLFLLSVYFCKEKIKKKKNNSFYCK